MTSVTRTLTAHYEACLAAHGPTPRGMDWGSDPDRLEARYETICRAIGLPGHGRPMELLDAGCGCGLFLDHLERRHPGRVRWSGLDASPAMVEACLARHGAVDVRLGDVLERVDGPTHDWVVANGLLTERRDIDELRFTAFAHEVLAALFARCRTGLVFNAMSDLVTFREPALFYWPPGDALRFCAASLSRHVTIHHDGPGYDYFCCVRRAPWREETPDG